MPFWSENENRFCPFWSVIRYGLRRNYGCVSKRSSFQFQIKERKSDIGIRNEFFLRNLFFFFYSFNLSNDDIISLPPIHVMLRFVPTSRSVNRYAF